jgi:hypothetical protein
MTALLGSVGVGVAIAMGRGPGTARSGGASLASRRSMWPRTAGLGTAGGHESMLSCGLGAILVILLL